MHMASTGGEQRPRSPGAVIQDVRAGVLSTTLNWFALGCMPWCGLVIWQAAVQGWPSAQLWILTGLAFGFVLLRIFYRRLGYRRSAILLLGQIAMISSYLLAMGQLTPGAALYQIMLVLAAVLFFGRKAGVLALCACVASIGTAGVLIVSGYVEPVAAGLNPSLPIVWIRYTLVFLLLGGAFIAAFARLISGLEASIVRAEQALAREIEERERHERAQAALERAQRLAALGQLAAGIAHDFNNSLTVILATSGLIEQVTTPGSEVFELAAEIRTAAVASANTARRLFSLGRRDERKLAVVSVAAFVAAIQSPLRRLLPASVSLGVEVSTTQAVLVDPSELEDALLNLAVNARDAMPQGGTLTLLGSDSYVTDLPDGWNAEGGAFVVIACRDTGSGMDSATVDKMFEPFFTTKEPGKGTGLGLAMVRKMMLEGNGYVSVQSAVGSGSTIGICLPRYVPPDDKPY